MKLFIFDSDKKLVWGFEKNRNFGFPHNYEFNPMGIPYENIEYDEIQKTRNQIKINFNTKKWSIRRSKFWSRKFKRKIYLHLKKERFYQNLLIKFEKN